MKIIGVEFEVAVANAKILISAFQGGFMKYKIAVLFTRGLSFKQKAQFIKLWNELEKEFFVVNFDFFNMPKGGNLISRFDVVARKPVVIPPWTK